MLPGPDPNTALAVERLLETDPEFKSTVRHLSIIAMKTLLYYMQNGTPDQKLSIARGFQPIFVKALAGEDGDKSTSDMLAETRNIITNIIPEEFK